jgi:hypothetical protein
VVARGVGEAGDGAGDVGDRGGRDRRDDARGADRHHDVAGAGGETECGGGVVARARPERRRAPGQYADLLGRSRDPGNGGPSAAHGQFEEVVAVLAGAGRPVGRAAGVPAVGGEVPETSPVRQPPGEPVVRQADGGRAVGVGGLGVGEPAELGRGEGGDRHEPDGVGPCLPAGRLVAVPEVGDQVGGGAGRPHVVPQQGVADDGAVLVEAHHAVLLAAHRQGRDVGQATGGLGRGGERLLPGARVDGRARRVRGAPGAHQFACAGVPDDDLAGLGGGVDAGHEGPARGHRAPPEGEITRRTVATDG